MENEPTATPPIEETTEWFALLYDPINHIEGKETAACFIGKLSDMQSDAVDIVFQASYRGKYPVSFFSRQSFPTGSKEEYHLNWLLSKSNVVGSRKEALDTAIEIADRVRGMDKSALKAYVESIEWADEPADTRTVEYSEKALDQRADGIKPVINALKEQNDILRERLPLPTTAVVESAITAPADSPVTESANDPQSISEPAATANVKLCRFLEKRPECRYWTSVDLGKQIGVADATVRKTVMWQVLTKERESIKKENKNKMALNSDYLSQAERKKHENSGREDRRET